MRKPAVIGLALVVAVAACIFIVGYWVGEPQHRGRTLTSWLQQSRDASESEPNQLEAQAAILAIGPEKALPTLFKLIRAKDSPAKLWLLEKAEKFNIELPPWPSEPERQFLAACGFEALGTSAAPAVPELIRMLDDKSLSFIAIRCLEPIGQPAELPLRRSLTNRNSDLRRFSVSALASAIDDVEVYIQCIAPSLKDTDSSVRFAAVQAISAQTKLSDLAVPLLIPALDDTEDAVCDQAAQALAGFGTNAVSAFAPLATLANTGRPAQMRAALKAFPAIAPTESVSVLSNVVVTGEAPMMGWSLKGLKTIAPDLALRMALTQFQSLDSQRRLQAVGLFGTYDLNTPGISAVLRLATADGDPEIAARASSAIRAMLEKRKERRRIVQLDNDPSFQGKSLGDWLNLKQVGGAYAGELSTNAVEALHQMGTNAVPALCHRLVYRDPEFGVPDSAVRTEALRALIVLGGQATPALPSLAVMMDSNDPREALFGMMATLGTGTNAVPLLMKGLTNQFPDVRNEAANTLTGEWSASFPEYRKPVIPYLINFLNDPDDSVRQNATNQLLEIAPATAAKIGVTARPNLHLHHMPRR